MRGRRPESSTIKALRGNAGHRSDSGTEPAPPAGCPEPPAHLDTRARRKWFERVAVMIQVPGWLTLFDADVLAAYCSAYAEWQEAEEELPVLKKSRVAALASARKARVGKLRDSFEAEASRLWGDICAMTGQRRKAMKAMKDFGGEIGWSSSSRTRIRLNGGQLNLPLAGGASPGASAPTPFERSQQMAGA